MTIDANDIANTLAWSGAILVLIAILGGTAFLIVKFFQLVAITSVEQNTGRFSSTLLQRWITFIVLMFLLVITHIEISINPFHIKPIALNEWLVLLLLSFIAGSKALKIWENAKTPEPGNQPVNKKEDGE